MRKKKLMEINFLYEEERLSCLP